MSRTTRGVLRWSALPIVAVVGIVLAGTLGAGRSGEPTARVREVLLVARDMEFFVLEGRQARVADAIDARVGETLRIVLRNEDPGMRHDLLVLPPDVSTAASAGVSDAAPARASATGPIAIEPATRPLAQTRILREGERAVVEVQLTAPGDLPFLCSLHPRTMRGAIRVQPTIEARRGD